MGHSRPRYNKQIQDQLDARRRGKRKASDDSGTAGNVEIIIQITAKEKARLRALRDLDEKARLSE